MSKTPVIAIFDIGKTNKKFFLFDEQYKIIAEKAEQFNEIQDEDGDACENLSQLTAWVRTSIDEAMMLEGMDIVAINFSTYGASFVHTNKEGQPVAPLYNYLKAFPEQLQQQFYQTYEGEQSFSIETASPVLGNLNSGLQLYYLKNVKPEIYKAIHYSLHLPQYMSYLITGRMYADITSIGCHTALWNFTKNRYHEWLYREGVIEKLANIFPSDQLMQTNWKGKPVLCGAGLHDSSAALIPYLFNFKEPFILLSTGTWCISLNPFNQTALTAEELKKDCLCYMEYCGKPVKASRLFAGYEHEQQVKRLASHFMVKENYYKTVIFDAALIKNYVIDNNTVTVANTVEPILQQSVFSKRDVNTFSNYNEAYHQLMLDIIQQQIMSTNLVLHNSPVKKIFVDGGFSKNLVYMSLLAAAFPTIEVYAASVAQASAIGAGLAVHNYWNKQESPDNFIELKHYAVHQAIEI